jgi:hypothetical protein
MLNILIISTVFRFITIGPGEVNGLGVKSTGCLLEGPWSTPSSHKPGTSVPEVLVLSFSLSRHGLNMVHMHVYACRQKPQKHKNQMYHSGPHFWEVKCYWYFKSETRKVGKATCHASLVTWVWSWKQREIQDVVLPLLSCQHICAQMRSGHRKVCRKLRGQRGCSV